MRDLGTLSGGRDDFSFARAMNNRNQVVGIRSPTTAIRTRFYGPSAPE